MLDSSRSERPSNDRLDSVPPATRRTGRWDLRASQCAANIRRCVRPELRSSRPTRSSRRQLRAEDRHAAALTELLSYPTRDCAARVERLKDLLAKDKKDDGLVFDELAVDHIFVD